MPTADQYRKALERLADSTEMAGAGDESQWDGPAAAELRHRIRYAQMALTEEFHAPIPASRRPLPINWGAKQNREWGS